MKNFKLQYKEKQISIFKEYLFDIDLGFLIEISPEISFRWFENNKNYFRKEKYTKHLNFSNHKYSFYKIIKFRNIPLKYHNEEFLNIDLKTF